MVAFQALLLGSGLVATRTGEAEEERVENVVQESALHHHEELADQFVWAAGLTLGTHRSRARRPASGGSAAALVSSVVAATIVVAALGLRVGHAGGQLVYVHGAASAYAQPSAKPDAHRDDRE